MSPPRSPPECASKTAWGVERWNVEETDGGTEDRRHEGTSILFLLNLVILSGLDTTFLSCYNNIIITIQLEFIIMKAIILKFIVSFVSLVNILIGIYILGQDVIVNHSRSKIKRSWRNVRSWAVLEIVIITV